MTSGTLDWRDYIGGLVLVVGIMRSTCLSKAHTTIDDLVKFFLIDGPPNMVGPLVQRLIQRIDRIALDRRPGLRATKVVQNMAPECRVIEQPVQVGPPDPSICAAGPIPSARGRMIRVEPDQRHAR